MKFERYGIGIAKGLAVTLRNFLGGPITTYYPEQKLTLSRRFRGYELVWDRELCTGCATCAKSCPQGNIVIETSRAADNKYEVEKFEVDSGRCIFCGLCVESCPFKALYLSNRYELARYRREELVLSKEQMLASANSGHRSGYFYPEVEAELPRQTLLIEGDKGKKA